MFKLTLNHLISFVAAVLALGLGLYVGRILLESAQVSLSIDESLATATAPNLNRALIEKAVAQLVVVKPTESIAPATSSQPTIPAPNLTPTPAVAVKPVIEIVNTTLEVGAAREVSVVFGTNAQISLLNGETELDETTLLYKNGYKEQVSAWKQKLETLGWSVKKEQSLAESEGVDIRLLLGK